METFPLIIFLITLTFTIYLLMNLLYVRFHYSILMPALTTTFLLVLILLITDTSYETFLIGGEWIARLLGPAVVSLAIPLYKQRKLVSTNLVPVFSGILVGVTIGMSTGIGLAKLFGFSQELVLSLLPKSITLPVAMDITEQLGGISSLTAIFVMVAGYTGIIFGPAFLKFLRIDTPIGRGMGLGASAHGIGTARALEYGPQDASVSSVAMSLSAAFGSFLAPVFVWIFYL